MNAQTLFDLAKVKPPAGLSTKAKRAWMHYVPTGLGAIPAKRIVRWLRERPGASVSLQDGRIVCESGTSRAVFVIHTKDVPVLRPEDPYRDSSSYGDYEPIANLLPKPSVSFYP